MKAVFFATNLLFGVLALILGGASLLSAVQSASFSAAVVGITVVALAAICLGLCKECLASHLKRLA